MAEGSNPKKPWLAMLVLTLWTASSCTQEPTLPHVLTDAERPTAEEIARAPGVEICELNARPANYLDELVRVHARLPSGTVFVKCEGWDLHFSFDEARMKRLSSGATLRTFYQLFSEDERRRNIVFDVVFLGRFTKREDGPNDRQLIVYSIERATLLDSGQR